MSFDNQSATGQVEAAIALLESSDEDSQKSGGHQLLSLGIGRNGGVRPRGTLSVCAQTYLAPSQEERIVSFLHNQPTAGKVILALGYHGGQRAVPAIIEIISTPDEELRLYCIETLRLLGGREATRTLGELIATSKDYRTLHSTLDAIEELGTGGRHEMSSSEPWSWTPRSEDDQSILVMLNASLNTCLHNNLTLGQRASVHNLLHKMPAIK